ncbi:MAG: YebC/PmpR family DNA-binding transcriptional regulator [Alphaproteobacteria bacterium]|nr:YebC/PmpR family DNA-binding transcriptional regulator [Alphaproteobacteria bacterium]
MAGHSQFKNIMHRKGAQDARRARLFTRLGREILVAAKSGLADPGANPRLKAAIQAARVANMPRDNIERIIKRAGGGGDDAAFEEVRYEGYGPGGVAIMVEALTDNRNRTAAEIRSSFTKHGGALGETNSVAFGFERIGGIQYPAAAAGADAMFEAALDAGAKDAESSADGHAIVTAPDDLRRVADALEARFGAPEAARLAWRPRTTVAVDGDAAASLFKLLGALDDNDDVQAVSANYDVAEDVMARLAG